MRWENCKRSFFATRLFLEPSNHCLKLDLDSDSYSDIFSSIWEAMVILKLNLILILDPASPLN